MRSVRIGGHRIPCRACRRHDSKVYVGGVYLCTSCLKAFVIGTKVGRILARREGSE